MGFWPQLYHTIIYILYLIMCVSLRCIWGLFGLLVHYLSQGGLFLLVLLYLMIIVLFFLFTPMGVAIKLTGFLQLFWSVCFGGYDRQHF
jgi:hypothetical protein